MISEPFKSLFLSHSKNGYHSHLLRPILLHASTVGVLLLKAVVLLVLSISYPDLQAFARISVDELLAQTNAVRQDQGLSALRSDSKLTAAAERKANHMLEAQYFNHFGPGGETPWQWMKEEGYIYTFAGENLAMNFSDPKDVMKAWLDSPTHRANILNRRYEDIGFAVVTGNLKGKPTTVLVEMFGKTYLESEQHPWSGVPLAEASFTAAPETEIAGEQISVAVSAPVPSPWTIRLLLASRVILFASLVIVLIALLLNIRVHLERRQGHILLRAVVVLVLFASLLALKFHWVEFLTGPLTII